MKEAEQIIQVARKAISAYCLSSCKAECCKRKSLRLDASESDLFGGVGECRIKLDPCPNLKDDRCSIYIKRPAACVLFPVRLAQLGKREVVTVSQCNAIEHGVIASHLDRLKNLDYEIFYPNN